MRWGIVATIKATSREVLDFVAYHLDLGADHIFIYLDAPTPKARAALEAHPKVTVRLTDDAYWQEIKRRKPVKHQVRQVANATHAYGLAGDMGLDWLGHIDVDEFICCKRNFGKALSAVPARINVARIAPAEAMASEAQTGLDPKAVYCKVWEHDHDRRAELESALYPTFGHHLRGGFVSHIRGKCFLRTGLGPLSFKIHRVMRGDEEVGPRRFMKNVDLCHRHIKSWESWRKSFDYRLDKGSYRSELKPTRPVEQGGLSAHQLFNFLIADNGEQALRDFFDEACTARPELLEGLKERDLLRVFYLDLDEKRERHFPNWRAHAA